MNVFKRMFEYSQSHCALCKHFTVIRSLYIFNVAQLGQKKRHGEAPWRFDAAGWRTRVDIGL